MTNDRSMSIRRKDTLSSGIPIITFPLVKNTDKNEHWRENVSFECELSNHQRIE